MYKSRSRISIASTKLRITYLTGDSTSFILLVRDIYSTMLYKYQSFQIESWLVEDGVYGGLDLLYLGSSYGLKGEYFHAK